MEGDSSVTRVHLLFDFFGLVIQYLAVEHSGKYTINTLVTVLHNSYTIVYFCTIKWFYVLNLFVL